MGGSKRRRAFLVAEIDIFSNIFYYHFVASIKFTCEVCPAKCVQIQLSTPPILVMLADSEIKTRGMTKEIAIVGM